MFEQGENITPLSGPRNNSSCSAAACSEGCGLQVHLYLCNLTVATMQGTDQEHHASYKNTEEQT